MHVVRFRFDRVFDQQLSPRRDFTTFGFEAQGKCIYSAKVHFQGRIPVGQDLLLAMRKKGDWRTIYGIATIASSEVQTGGFNIGDWLPLVVINLAGAAFAAPLVAWQWQQMPLPWKAVFSFIAFGISAISVQHVQATLLAARARRLLISELESAA